MMLGSTQAYQEQLGFDVELLKVLEKLELAIGNSSSYCCLLLLLLLALNGEEERDPPTPIPHPL